MLIRLGYDIQFEQKTDVPMIALLNVHPSRVRDLREPDQLRLDPAGLVERYTDGYGNICTRLTMPAGHCTLFNSTLISDTGLADERNQSSAQLPVEELPVGVLQYLLGSRYCEVDLFTQIAAELFGHVPPGWAKVQAICDWVQQKVTFGYNFARPTKTALDVYTERTGVCRDFQHLAITLCRCCNIPARYATGYLGDIGVPVAPYPMDFSAWFEVYLSGGWWTWDARHNQPRIGRVLMAVGRDAADVAITTIFGQANLTKFEIITDEVAQTSAVAAD